MMPRAQRQSGAALRYERQRREATAALAAQAAQVRALREADHPPVVEGGGAEPETGKPVTEQNQRLKAVAKAPKLAPIIPEIIPAAPHEPGRWPITALREGQCRFACTSHSARPHQHLFCGEPVAWKGNKSTSWCRDHLPMVCGAPGRAAGGASVADAAAGKDDRDAQPARSGWGSTGA